MDFLALLKKAGFEDAELVAETGFNSSPKTKGTLFFARKPLIHKKGAASLIYEDSGENRLDSLNEGPESPDT